MLRLLQGSGTPDPVLIVAAHPDDETIGMGARLPWIRNLHLVHVTDGAPRDMKDAVRSGFSTAAEYARARTLELGKALAMGGVQANRLELGIADQEATAAMERLTFRLSKVLEDCQPALVLTHPYEGGHPDHDATAFAVRQAVTIARSPWPVLAEFSSYHSWRGALRACEFLPGEEATEAEFRLSPTEQRLKRRMLACFETQEWLLSRFPVDRERFRLAPAYDFTQPPACRDVYYDRCNWGTTGEGFRTQAARVLQSLALVRPCA